MSTSIHIRPALREDLAAVTTLVAELNLEEGYSISASAEAMADLLFPAQAATRVHMRVLVAEERKRIVGALLYYWGYDTVSASYGYHLADIIVTRTQRSQRIGATLFAALAAACLAEGGQWMSLTVLKKNARAQNFYRAQGMVEVAVDFFAIGPHAMAKCIARRA